MDEARVREVLQTLIRRYGEDIAQEAWLYALSKPRDDVLGYATMTARYLKRTGYDDTCRSRARWHTWDREVSHSSGEEDDDQPGHLWGWQGGKDPAYLAMLREQIRKVPQWIVLYCVEEDFIWGGPKCAHPWRYLALRAVPGNHRVICCQVCRTNREQKWRHQRLERRAS
jgi:hypothetical protein